MASTLLKLAIPNQHGAWIILISSLAVGVLAVGRINHASALFLFAVFFGFVAYHNFGLGLKLQDTKRKRLLFLTFVMGIHALACVALLIMRYHLYELPLFGLGFAVLAGAQLHIGIRKREKSLLGEFIGVAALSATAPIMIYVTKGGLDVRMFGFWFLCLAFFFGSVINVRYSIRKNLPFDGSGHFPLVYHIMTLLLAVFLGRTGLLHPPLILALIPGLVRAVWIIVHRRERLSIRKIGLAELASSAVFVTAVFITGRNI